MTSKALDHLKTYPPETLDETTLRYSYDMALDALLDAHKIRARLTAEQALERWDPVFVEDDLEHVEALRLILLDRQRRVDAMRSAWLLNANIKETTT